MQAFADRTALAHALSGAFPWTCRAAAQVFLDAVKMSDLAQDPSATLRSLFARLVVHGPNLNLLGQRETQHYGTETLASIDARLAEQGKQGGCQVVSFQSNSESELIDRVHAAKSDGTAFIIINPAGFTHTTVALRDALAAVSIPFIEVHLSNVHAREPFRKHSYFSDLARGVICGLGPQGYEMALAAAMRSATSQEADVHGPAQSL